MANDLEMDNIEQRVLLLGLYKKQDDETFIDVINVMENSRVFTKKTGKKYLKNLKALNYITDDSFTMIGIQKAKEIEMEFKI
ncbi:MAG: hypothetical protein U9O56_07560 [Campylobacterota bacterium]|nr:hypothetical protein [Campylobacterota bacterium]